MKAIFRFITDVKTGATDILEVPADAIDKTCVDGQQPWFTAWKGEDIVAMVNAEFVKFCYLEQ